MPPEMCGCGPTCGEQKTRRAAPCTRHCPYELTKSPLTHRQRNGKELRDDDETYARQHGHRSRTRDPSLAGG